jgi:hypothetical protein
MVGNTQGLPATYLCEGCQYPTTTLSEFTKEAPITSGPTALKTIKSLVIPLLISIYQYRI